MVSLIHAVETVKFVASWSDYRNAIVVLATSSKSDPALGNPRFVSAERISPTLTPLSWFSTVPYLSIILSNFIGWSSIPLEITSGYPAEQQ